MKTLKFAFEIYWPLVFTGLRVLKSMKNKEKKPRGCTTILLAIKLDFEPRSETDKITNLWGCPQLNMHGLKIGTYIRQWKLEQYCADKTNFLNRDLLVPHCIFTIMKHQRISTF